MKALESALRVQAARELIRRRKKAPKMPRPRYPTNERLLYYKQLAHVVDVVQFVVKRDLLPKIPAILDAHNATRPRTDYLPNRPRVPEGSPEGGQHRRSDSTDTDIDELFDEVEQTVQRAIPEPGIRLAVQQSALRTSQWNGNELAKQVQQVAKINLFDDSTGLAQHLELFVADNVRLVKSLAADHLEDLKGIVVRGARAGLTDTDVAQQIQQRFGVAYDRAALIATDQIGKLNGELNQLRQQNLGVRRYRWSSSQDERVRKLHRDLNGTIQEWAKPPVIDARTGQRGHPGQAIRCRCSPIPIIDDVLVDAGLMDPADVELTHPTTGKQASLRPVSLPPVMTPPAPPVPPLPPANVNQPPPPPPPPPSGPPGGGGGGAPPGPPGGGSGSDDPPDDARRRKTLDDLRQGLAQLPTKGGPAPTARGAVQTLLEQHYGLARAGGQADEARARLEVTKGRPDSAKHYLGGRIEIESVVLAEIKSGLSKLKRGDSVSEVEANALATLLHEELHGMGGERVPGTYGDGGRLVEEVTSETLSRKITRHLLGKSAGRVGKHHPLAFPTTVSSPARAYDEEIEGVLADIRTVTRVDVKGAQQLLEAGAFSFKRSGSALTTAEAYAERFVAALPGLTAKQRRWLVEALVARSTR